MPRPCFVLLILVPVFQGFQVMYHLGLISCSRQLKFSIQNMNIENKNAYVVYKQFQTALFKNNLYVLPRQEVNCPQALKNIVFFFIGKSSQNPDSWAWTDAVEIIVGKAARPYIKYEHEKIRDDYDRLCPHPSVQTKNLVHGQ